MNTNHTDKRRDAEEAQKQNGCDDCGSKTRTLDRYSDAGGIAVLCDTCADTRWA
jgi:hypothetical protein